MLTKSDSWEIPVPKTSQAQMDFPNHREQSQILTSSYLSAAQHQFYLPFFQRCENDSIWLDNIHISKHLAPLAHGQGEMSHRQCRQSLCLCDSRTVRPRMLLSKPVCHSPSLFSSTPVYSSGESGSIEGCVVELSLQWLPWSGCSLCSSQKAREPLKEHTYWLLLLLVLWNSYGNKESVCAPVKWPPEETLSFLLGARRGDEF